MSENGNNSLKVGDLLVEPALNRIGSDRGTVNLRPQVMDLLVFLASNESRVVSVDELLDKVWPGKVVTDGTVYNCIGELRQAISSLDDTQPYIENIPKKGYRLAVAVRDSREPRKTYVLDRTDGTRNAKNQLLHTKFALALFSGLFVAVAAITYLAWPREIRSIAVIPFEDISPAHDQAYLANGIADELRLELQHLDGLRVAGRTSSIAYAEEDSKTMSELLNVDAIIEGSVRREGNNVRITTQLTHAADGFTLWSESYNRKLENIFEMQEDIATSVAGALGVRLGVGTINAFRGAGTRNVEAYQLYLQAQHNDWSMSGVREKIRLLERAVELDPNYAAAWSSLGHAMLVTTWNVGLAKAPEIVEKAHQLVLRGVQLNPESATAHSVLAAVLEYKRDWVGAERSHRRALELLPDRPNVKLYSYALMRTGRTAYAQEQFRIAYALEPLGGRPFGLAWHASLAQGRIAEAQEISNWQGPDGHIENNLDMAFNVADLEKLEAAIRAMPETSIARVMLYDPVLAEVDSPERVLLILREVYQDEHLQWLRKLHDIAMLAAYFGDLQFAVKVKGEEIRRNVNRITALWYPVMSEARKLPEFKRLVTDLNLVEYWRAYGWSDYCRPLGDEDFECS